MIVLSLFMESEQRAQILADVLSTSCERQVMTNNNRFGSRRTSLRRMAPSMSYVEALPEGILQQWATLDSAHLDRERLSSMRQIWPRAAALIISLELSLLHCLLYLRFFCAFMSGR